MQLITEVSGFLASLTSFLVWLPQARRVWVERHDPTRLAGVSVPTQVLSLAGNALWLIHAIGIGSFWLGAPSVVNIPVILMTVVLVRRAATRVLVDEAIQAMIPDEVPPALAEIPVLEAALTSDDGRSTDHAEPEGGASPEDFARAV